MNPIGFAALGAAVGAVLGMLVFWPSFFGQPLSVSDVLEMLGRWERNSQDFLVPMFIKSAVTAVIGGGVGYLMAMLLAGNKPPEK